jgi:hypothetical protein
MKNILKAIPVFLLCLLISKTGNAQNYYTYQAFDAVMLRVSDDNQIESRLEKVLLVLSNNSSQLNVRINIPCDPVNSISDDHLSAPGLPFELKMTINPWEIQDEITSAKVLIAQGIATMNNVVKAVKVEYIPLPAGPDQDGSFKLSMIIQFNPGDFDQDAQLKKSQIIIKISDARVNRV